MNELQTFDFNGTSIRMLDINYKPYFVGKDVVDVLGYQNGSRDINRHVDDEDKATVTICDGSQNRNVIVINESGLYSLILSSKLPAAKDFKRWVTSEVLPAIRKNGAYLPQITGFSEEKVSEILFRWKVHEKFPSLTFQQIDACFRLIPLYPQITYAEIARAICLSSAMISLIKDYMLKLEA